MRFWQLASYHVRQTINHSFCNHVSKLSSFTETHRLLRKGSDYLSKLAAYRGLKHEVQSSHVTYSRL